LRELAELLVQTLPLSGCHALVSLLECLDGLGSTHGV
jgi:hypothetical protein